MVQEKCLRFAACGSDDALRPEAKEEEVEILYWQWRHSGGRRKSERQFIQENPGKKCKDSSEDCNFGVFNVIPNAMTLHAPMEGCEGKQSV